MIPNRVVASTLRMYADKIEKNEWGLDDEEMQSLVATMFNRKRNIEQICQDYGISRATLNRWQEKGKLPPFHKDSGGKYYLYSNEADAAIRRWERAHMYEAAKPPRHDT